MVNNKINLKIIICNIFSWIFSKRLVIFFQLFLAATFLVIWSIFSFPYSNIAPQFHPQVMFIDDNDVLYASHNRLRTPRMIFEYKNQEYHALCFGEILRNSICDKELSGKKFLGEKVVFLKALESKKRVEGIFISGILKSENGLMFDIETSPSAQKDYLANRGNSNYFFQILGQLLVFYMVTILILNLLIFIMKFFIVGKSTSDCLRKDAS